MQGESCGDRGIERVDSTARGEAPYGRARAAHGATHALMLVAHHEDRRAGQIELTDALRSVRVQADHCHTPLASRSQGADQRLDATQARMLDGARRGATSSRT